MNLAGTQYTLKNRAFDVYVSGCTRHCRGCFNEQAQDFNYGEPLIVRDIVKKIKENSDLIDTVRFLGGDLLCNDDAEEIVREFQLLLNVNYELYTGADRDEVPAWCWDRFDVIKVGKFDDTKLGNGELASTNQCYLRKGVDY